LCQKKMSFPLKFEFVLQIQDVMDLNSAFLLTSAGSTDIPNSDCERVTPLQVKPERQHNMYFNAEYTLVLVLFCSIHKFSNNKEYLKQLNNYQLLKETPYSCCYSSFRVSLTLFPHEVPVQLFVLSQVSIFNSDEQISLKYAAKGITAPVNVLWMYLFVKGQDAAAKKLWDEHLAGSPRVMFQYILQEAREMHDESIPRKLIALLQGTAVSEGARGNAYSCLYDVLGK